LATSTMNSLIQSKIVKAKRPYNCLIIGAGPAGLFAAYELVKQGMGKILIIDKGKDVRQRTVIDTLHGVGGAGLFSDGKLIFAPRVDKTDLTEFLTLVEAEKLVDYIEKIFSQFGVREKSYPTDIKKAEELRRKAKKSGLDLLLVKQKHLGSDCLPSYVEEIEKFLKRKKVKFLLGRGVSKILAKGRRGKAIKLVNGEEIFGENIIVAPGRVGNSWLVKELRSLRIEMEQKGIEIGIRIEVPAVVMEEITSVIYDPTIIITTASYDDRVRTFCTNPVGFVVREDYEKFACVNGHASRNHTSSNSNFALLNKISLTEPVTDTIAYGESICKLATTIGAGKPILQRLADFKRRRRSTWRRLGKSYIEPTLKDVTPGDITMAFPHRMTVNLIEALERLNEIIPGVASDSTLLYAPEAKFFSVRPKINKNMETKIKGLFVAGDGAGVSGNIIGAAATGIIAARGIISG
jgi:uncharacterized FAD-dependent dehydrogenase